jgi:hypothetical protein
MIGPIGPQFRRTSRQHCELPRAQQRRRDKQYASGPPWGRTARFEARRSLVAAYRFDTG